LQQLIRQEKGQLVRAPAHSLQTSSLQLWEGAKVAAKTLVFFAESGPALQRMPKYCVFTCHFHFAPFYFGKTVQNQSGT